MKQQEGWLWRKESHAKASKFPLPSRKVTSNGSKNEELGAAVAWSCRKKWSHVASSEGNARTKGRLSAKYFGVPQSWRNTIPKWNNLKHQVLWLCNKFASLQSIVSKVSSDQCWRSQAVKGMRTIHKPIVGRQERTPHSWRGSRSIVPTLWNNWSNKKNNGLSKHGIDMPTLHWDWWLITNVWMQYQRCSISKISKNHQHANRNARGFHSKPKSE